MLSGCLKKSSSTTIDYSLPLSFIYAGASMVLIQKWPIPTAASLKFFQVKTHVDSQTILSTVTKIPTIKTATNKTTTNKSSHQNQPQKPPPLPPLQAPKPPQRKRPQYNQYPPKHTNTATIKPPSSKTTASN